MKLIVNGVHRLAPQRDMTMPTGEKLAVAVLTDDHAELVLEGSERSPLTDIPTDEIIAFLHNVGKNWKSGEYAQRWLYTRHLRRYLGYSPREAELEADWIALTLCSHFRMHSLLESELGDRYALDRWIPRQEAEVRAWPRGRVLHYLSGNLPVVALTSILRGVLTKNANVVKLPSGDPITAHALAASFADVDPDHPVTRSLSVLWWESGRSPAGERLAAAADAIVAWGGEDTMRWIAEVASPETEITWFGPRRSVAVIDASSDVGQAARRLAHDVSVYQQRGCFNVHQAFVLGGTSALAEALALELALYAEMLPCSEATFDEAAAQSLALLEARFAGLTVHEPSQRREWAIVEGPPPDPQVPHPLGRTVYLSEIQRPGDAAAFTGPDVQTVAVHPYALVAELRDEFALAGAHRLVELGMTNLFRLGSTHDSIYPLARLVRRVSCDLPSCIHTSGVTMRVDQTQILRDEALAELIP